MREKSEYTLSLRIDAASIAANDFDAIDDALGVIGSRIHVDRPAGRFRLAQRYDRWEVEATDGAAHRFGTLKEAFSAIDGARIASSMAEFVPSRYGKVYWWCGCFHEFAPTLTVITEEMIDVLGKSEAPITLDTYHSVEALEQTETSDDPGANVDDEPYRGHGYRFKLTSYPYDPAEGVWGKCFEDFGVGLEALLYELGDSVGMGLPCREQARQIICEHRQQAYDGGPRLTAAQACAIASRGLGLSILWRHGPPHRGG